MKSKLYDEKVKPRLSEISEWILGGDSFEDIAAKLGVSDRALLRYRKAFPEFQDALDAGRDSLVKLVENTFYKRLIGKTVVKRIKTVYKYDADGNAHIESREIKEEPWVACTADYVFFLRQYPNKWRNEFDLSENGDYKKNQDAVLKMLKEDPNSKGEFDE